MNDILLESGTNELEILEFRVGNQIFGINVAKITEIMSYQPVTEIPDTNPALAGIFIPRDKVISVVDLHKILNKELPKESKGMFVICHFNQIDVAFHVTSVLGIQRISWDAIEKPPTLSATESDAIATGVTKIKDDLVLILDFEKIVSELNATAILDTANVEGRTPTEKHIVVAEDSVMLNTLIVKSLNDAGYTNVTHFDNGKSAWDYISNLADPTSIACIISDIEMPQMDGHNLTKRIKSDEKLATIPVCLFSSLINDQIRAKGEQVGANAQFSKPQIAELITYLNSIV